MRQSATSYLDSAATTLKPQSVIDAIADYYGSTVAPVHRATNRLGDAATARFEAARATIAKFIGASPDEIALVAGATAAINAIAHSLTNDELAADVGSIAVADSEHHSNLLPWRHARLSKLPAGPHGVVDTVGLDALVRHETPALLTVSLVTNAWGVRQPIAEICRICRLRDVPVLLDLSQCAGHEPIDVRRLCCDFAVFSGHKMLGPEGIGVLFARREMTARLRPLTLGGGMVRGVTADSYEALPFPHNLEAGSPHVAGAIGLAAACEYLSMAGLERIQAHGLNLVRAARSGFAAIAGVRVLGVDPPACGPIVAFQIAGVDAHAASRILSDQFGIMLRSGYHCAQPLHADRGITETIRASFHLYNDEADVDRLVDAVCQIASEA